MASKESSGLPEDYTQQTLAELIHKHCFLALSGGYKKLPKSKQLMFINWIREANKRLIDERKRVQLIMEAKKMGFASEAKRLS